MEDQVNQNSSVKITFEDNILLSFNPLKVDWQSFRCINCSNVQNEIGFNKVSILFKYRGKIDKIEFIDDQDQEVDAVLETKCYKCKAFYRIVIKK